MSSKPETVLVVGVFDLFHVGHVRLLQNARAMGDRLVVVVNGDRLTTSYKRAPVMSEHDRLAVIQACRYVDVAEVSNDYDVKPFIQKYGITQIAHGDDWDVESYKHQIRCDDTFLEEHGARLVFLPYTPGVSTSDIIKRCAGLHSENSR